MAQSWKIPELQGDELLTPRASSGEHPTVTQVVQWHAKSPTSLGHVQFQLLVHWTSHPSKIFATEHSCFLQGFGALVHNLFQAFLIPSEKSNSSVLIKSSTTTFSGRQPCTHTEVKP